MSQDVRVRVSPSAPSNASMSPMNTLIFHSNDLAMAQSSFGQFNFHIRLQTKLLTNIWRLYCVSNVAQQPCDIVINRSGLDKILVLFDNKIC